MATPWWGHMSESVALMGCGAEQKPGVWVRVIKFDAVYCILCPDLRHLVIKINCEIGNQSESNRPQCPFII